MTRPSCAHADICPGCPLLDVPPDEQATLKRARLARALAAYPVLEGLEVAPAVMADPPLGYRARAKWVAKDGRIGLFSRGGHEIVDLPGCVVVRDELRAATQALRALTKERPALRRALVGADLRSARDGEGRAVLATWVLRDDVPRSAPWLREAAEALIARSAVIGVAVSTRPEGSPKVLGGVPVPLVGAVEAWDETGRARTLASHGAFVQAHAGQAAKLHDALAAIANERGVSPRVLDVYGGSGPIALALAAKGAHVTLVESFAPAARAARRAADAAGLTLEVRQGDAAELPAGSYDLVIANPPRRGLAARLRARLPALAPVVAIVSCDPDSLARDLSHLAWIGLRAERATPFDMIPQSREVETLVVLRAEPPPPLRVLHEDEGLVVVDKPPFLPTTPQGEHTGSLLALVRRLPGAREAVPLHRLDVGTSGVCVFVKHARRVPPYQAALAAAEKTYVAWARGVLPRHGVVDRPLREAGKMKAARTRFVRRERVGPHALLECTIETGHKHQIRRHLEGIGHPVLGDERYGHPATNAYVEATFGLDRPFLHCERLTLPSRAGAPLQIESPLAPDLLRVLERARAEASRARSVGDSRRPR